MWCKTLISKNNFILHVIKALASSVSTICLLLLVTACCCCRVNWSVVRDFSGVCTKVRLRNHSMVNLSRQWRRHFSVMMMIRTVVIVTATTCSIPGCVAQYNWIILSFICLPFQGQGLTGYTLPSRSNLHFFTARHYASAVLPVIVCLSICHKSELYKDG